MHYCSCWRSLSCLLLQVMPDLFELDALLAADQLSGLKFGKNFSRGSRVALDSFCTWPQGLAAPAGSAWATLPAAGTALSLCCCLPWQPGWSCCASPDPALHGPRGSRWTLSSFAWGQDSEAAWPGSAVKIHPWVMPMAFHR